MVRGGMTSRVTRMALLVSAALTLEGAGVEYERFALPPTPPRFHKPPQGVLFADDFSGDSLRGWVPDQPGVWTLWRGMLRADLPDQKQLRSVIRAGDSTWSDVAIDVDMCMMRGVDKGAIVRVQGISGTGVDLRGGTYQDVLMYQGSWPMGRAQATNANGTWNHLRVEARGNHYRVFVNGEQRLDRSDGRMDVSGSRLAGGIALPAYTGGIGQCTVYYDNVVVTALK